MEQDEMKEFLLSLNKARECHGRKIALLERDTEANSNWLKRIWLTIGLGFLGIILERLLLG